MQSLKAKRNRIALLCAVLFFVFALYVFFTQTRILYLIIFGYFISVVGMFIYQAISDEPTRNKFYINKTNFLTPLSKRLLVVALGLSMFVLFGDMYGLLD